MTSFSSCLAARAMAFRRLALLALTVAGCSSDPTGPSGPPPINTITVQSTSAVYLTLDDTARIVAVSDPATSAGWDISVLTTAITLNGGTTGPGGVTGYCLCANASATSEQVRAMTSAGQLAAFENVTAADIPATAEFRGDVFTTQRWYRYNITGTDNQIWPVYNIYLIRRGTSVYKIQITGYYNAAAEPRHVTLRYARLTE
jgi:hypothetical protein